MSNILDLRTKKPLTILSDEGKNFTVKIEGFDNLDLDYNLVLVSEISEEEIISNVGNGNIILDYENKTLTMVFQGDDYSCGVYKGSLQSVNKDAGFYYFCEIILKIE